MMGDTPNERKIASNGDSERLEELKRLLESTTDPSDRPSIEAEIFQLEQMMSA